MRKPSVASKLCVRCGKVLPLTKFYMNRSWSAQSYHDAWCKDCATQYCIDIETLKQYCYENNRMWKDVFWDSALKKAQYVLATDPEYINPRVSDEKKKRIENQIAARQFFGMMNLTRFYFYVDNMSEDSEGILDEKRMATDPNKRTYNRKWGGFFTQEEIEAQEDIYSQYEEDFVLDNVNIRDYARKVAKASLNADIAEDKMRRGQLSASEYKEAQRIFDDLSKSSNFAACKRKPGEASGMGSLGEIIMRLEISGALKTNGFTFPEDDVDRIENDFRHTLRAVGIEGQL